ncbi:uncharacterized protein si:dkeyp-117h8.4 isoform X2 [Electrophorus electricus]|nr:uncharacterized protein si:dkeyp-117h8.4 isoform X2 [Electrophorus electricus]
MTFRTGNGAVPIDSMEAERELQRLRGCLKARQSLHDTSVVLVSAKDAHDLSEQEMDVTQRTENELDCSNQTQNSLCNGTKTTQLSVSGPHGCAWMEPSQLVEEDQELERTLSSHGSTLLDVYPSMLDQIGKVYHRQRVTDAASTVLQKYRRQRWRPSRDQGHRHDFSCIYNHTLNKESSFTTQKPLHSNRTRHHKSRSSAQADSLCGSKVELSPYKSTRNSPSASSGCFYSPRRDSAEESVAVKKGSPHQPVRVLDLLTFPSSSSTCSSTSSLDLNQTYDIEPVAMPVPRGFLAAAVCSPTRSKCNSPQKQVKSPLLIGRGGRPKISSQFPYDSRPGPEQEYIDGFVSREHFRNSRYFPATSLQQASIGFPVPGGRSPLRPRVLGQEEEQQMSSTNYYPKQTLPVNYMDASVVQRSPYRSQQKLLSSPLSGYQQNLTMSELHQDSPKPTKRWQAHAGLQTVSSSVSHMSRRKLDAEFRRIYHHFICQGPSSSRPTSFCHLCESRLDDGVQRRSYSSSSLSALALTPPWGRLKKRRRQPEMEESLRFKRFRESCSPLSQSKQLWLKEQQEEPNEDKRTWNRALLLQCPSPGLLRAGDSIRKVPSTKLGLPTHKHSPSWRDSSRCIGAVEGRSPVRTWKQRGVSLSPSMSRRRLLYGPLQ